jgi:uncharacterized protein YcnI
MHRTAVFFTAGAIALVALAAPAAAHVTVNPNEAAQGDFTQLTFRVPNEKDNASTVRVEVAFPADHPLAFVSVRPVPGWTSTVDKTKLAAPIKSDDGDVTEAVSRITWTAAQGSEIKAGEYQNFDVSAGPLPKDATSITFKALQTYSDGDIVRWIEESTPGGPEPDHPAPTLKLTSATSSETSAPTPTTAASRATSAASVRKTSDGTARSLGIVGIVVAALALATAGTAIAQRRR